MSMSTEILSPLEIIRLCLTFTHNALKRAMLLMMSTIPTASFIFDMRVATQYASPPSPIYPQGDRVCYQPVGPQAKDLPSLHLTSSRAMWKGSWRNCGSFSQPFTIVLPAVSRACISLTICSVSSVSWNASRSSHGPPGRGEHHPGAAAVYQ